MLQVWWHGAKNHRGEGVWVHMLSEWGAGHRLACPCHSVKLQPYLPPKPAGRETTSPEGTDSPSPSVFLILSLPFLSIFILLLSSVPVLSAHNRMTGQTLSSRILIFYCVSVYVCIGWLNLLQYISMGERNKRKNDNDRTNDLQNTLSAVFQ